MPTKGGRKQKEKKLKYQLKLALQSNKDPIPYLQKLEELRNYNKVIDLPQQNTYSLSLSNVNISPVNYKTIPKGDPRRVAYKIKELFGADPEPLPPPPSPPGSSAGNN